MMDKHFKMKQDDASKLRAEKRAKFMKEMTEQKVEKSKERIDNVITTDHTVCLDEGYRGLH